MCWLSKILASSIRSHCLRARIQPERTGDLSTFFLPRSSGSAIVTLRGAETSHLNADRGLRLAKPEACDQRLATGDWRFDRRWSARRKVAVVTWRARGPLEYGGQVTECGLRWTPTQVLR